MNNKEFRFVDEMNKLRLMDEDRFNLIVALLEAHRDNKIIRVSRDLNTDNPKVVIYISDSVVYKHQCDSEEEAILLVNLIRELNKDIKAAV